MALGVDVSIQAMIFGPGLFQGRGLFIQESAGMGCHSYYHNAPGKRIMGCFPKNAERAGSLGRSVGRMTLTVILLLLRNRVDPVIAWDRNLHLHAECAVRLEVICNRMHAG